MDKNFPKCLTLVLASEGGNSDNPHDPGGRTSRGVTQREYDAYRLHEHLPHGDVFKAADSEVRQIYHDSYWLPWCDRLPRGLDYMFFDMAVNMGSVAAIKMIQRAVNVPADGHFGLVTKVLMSRTPLTTLLKHVSMERQEFYRELPTFKYFGTGWLNRCQRVEHDALQMVP